MLDRSPETLARFSLESFCDEAACVGEDLSLIFSEDMSVQDSVAHRLCSACPVRVECLVHAIVHGEAYGVWGGFNEVRRRSVKRSINTTVNRTGVSVYSAATAYRGVAGMHGNRVRYGSEREVPENPKTTGKGVVIGDSSVWDTL